MQNSQTRKINQNMTEIVVIGAGGHAAEIDEYVSFNRQHNFGDKLRIIGFLDDNPDNYIRYRFSAPLLGSASSHNVNSSYGYVLGIAGIRYRRFFVERFLMQGASFVSLIHAGAYISGSAIIGEGSIIGPNASIGPNVRVGKYNLINARSSLGHDTVVGDFNFISPNTCFSGFTEVGEENLFGINSATLPGIKIGNRNKIAAGMIMDTNIGDDNIVFYRYKERVIAVPKYPNAY